MRLLTAILMVITIACSNKIKNEKRLADSRLWNIKLEDSLGTIEIVLPKQLDTLFRWTEYSDCGDGCAYSDYRIQEKSLPIFKDDGFIYFPLRDSVEQFTIKHSKLIFNKKIQDSSFKQNDSLITLHFLQKLKVESFNKQNYKYLIDTILTINDKMFAMIAYSRFDSVKRINQLNLSAGFGIKGNAIQVCFEHRKSYTDSLSNDFIKNAFESVKTIRIKE